MGFGYKDSGGSDFKDSSMGYKEAKGESTSGGYGSSMGYRSTTNAKRAVAQAVLA